MQQEIIGKEIIGRPGQNLTAAELIVLVGLAEGVPTPIVAERIGGNAASLRHIEQSIQSKLGAKNKANMIARGFLLGVLAPNWLCLLICLATLIDSDFDALRPRTRRTRSGPQTVRLIKHSPSHAGARPLTAIA